MASKEKDDKQLTATPYAKHIPDSYTDTEKAEGASWPLGGGFYELGLEVNGVQFPLAQLHGGEVEKRIAAAKEKAAAAESDTGGSEASG